MKNYDFEGRFILRNFYFAFIHGFLVKQVFIISVIVVVVIDLLVGKLDHFNLNIVHSES